MRFSYTNESLETLWSAGYRHELRGSILVGTQVISHTHILSHVVGGKAR